MPLDIEEELDLAALGFDAPLVSSTPTVDTTSRSSTFSSPGSPSSSSLPRPRLVSGRYASADWIPERVYGELSRSSSRALNSTVSPNEPSEEDIASEENVGPQNAESSPILSNQVVARPRKPTVTIKLARIPGSRHRRKAIRVFSLPSLSGTETDASTLSRAERRQIAPGPGGELVDRFGAEVYERIENMAKLNGTTGVSLPSSVRDLFPALSDLSTAIPLVNAVRQSLNLPSIRVTKTNKLDLLRSVAQLRSSLYITLMTSLTMPSAPIADADEQDLSEEDEKKITLTPDNLRKLGSTIPKAFPAQKALIKAVLADEARLAYGERGGRVVWQGGIGRVVGAEGGFRGKNLQDGNVHVFLDHSNVLYGLLHCLYSDPSDSLPPKHLRTLSLPALSLLLRRGRPTPPGTLHAVASSPLKQDLDPLVRLGWEVSVLKRVEIQEDEVEDPDALNLTPRPMARLPVSGELNGLRRYKEQAVDEILQLKLLQALNARPEGRGGTIVLATGDAKGGQFNRDGFVGAVREAIKRDWAVELWSFRLGLSRTWIEVAKRERWFVSGGLSIHYFDEWSESLVEVI